jgi:hypothetical protein
MKRTQHTYVQTNAAPPDRVFPLLCPVREAEWVPDWKYRLVYSESGVAELGCVFATPNPDGSETTWVVTEYDPARYWIAFAWVWPQMLATRLFIQLASDGGSQTKATITYQYTALSDAGERELERYNCAWYEAKMAGWQEAINHYLVHGTSIAASAWE